MSPSRSPFSSTLLILVICLAGCRADASSDSAQGSHASPPPRAAATGGGADDVQAPVDDPPENTRPSVVFLGNSLTAGLGVSPLEAFPALLAARMQAAGLPFEVVNAGISGETTAGGLRRIDWVLEQSPAVLVLALGANDALRGAPPESIESNLQQIIDRTRERLPDTRIVLAGMLAPPNMGETYTEAFRAVFVDLARKNETTLIPFLLEGVAADPSLNQADGIHPTAGGHEIIAETVWGELHGVLEAVSGSPTSSDGS